MTISVCLRLRPPLVKFFFHCYPGFLLGKREETAEQKKDERNGNKRNQKTPHDELTRQGTVSPRPFGKDGNRGDRRHRCLERKDQGYGESRFYQDQQPENNQGKEDILGQDKLGHFPEINVSFSSDLAHQIVIEVSAKDQHEQRRSHGADHNENGFDELGHVDLNADQGDRHPGKSRNEDRIEQSGHVNALERTFFRKKERIGAEHQRGVEKNQEKQKHQIGITGSEQPGYDDQGKEKRVLIKKPHGKFTPMFPVGHQGAEKGQKKRHPDKPQPPQWHMPP
ncbi:MAG: hypothetical protein H6R43_634, partial [Nitrospirae bacterium]|nr:hypothetical protein [Nitrospirota bacterium]